MPAAPPLTPANAPAAPAEFVQTEVEVAAHDDAVAMPAPSADYLAHRPHVPAHTRRHSAGSTGVRATLIPVLLTIGVLLLATAVLKYLVHPDAPLAAVPTWLAVVLAVGGVALAGVAVLNGIQVRRAAAEAANAGRSSAV